MVLLGTKRCESTCWETPLQLGTPGKVLPEGPLPVSIRGSFCSIMWEPKLKSS